jgi:hypothetical protein
VDPCRIQIREDVILIYGSEPGSRKPVSYGSGSYLDFFVALKKIGCHIPSTYIRIKNEKILNFFLKFTDLNPDPD